MEDANLRAEYGEVRDCYEGVPARYIFAPLFKDLSKKMVIGEPGTGKTHLLRLLADEIPARFYDLDKDALVFDGRAEYRVLVESENPEAIIVDDLHYLLGAMQLYAKKNREAENEILRLLAGFIRMAREKNAVPIFASSEGPGSLSSRFADEKNQLRFMRMFQDCINTPDDKDTLEKKLKNTTLQYGNTLDLNNRGFVYSIIVRVPGGYGIESLDGFRVLFPDSELSSESSLSEHEFANWHIENVQRKIGLTVKNVANAFGIKDLPFFMPSNDSLRASPSVDSRSAMGGVNPNEELHYERKDGQLTGNIKKDHYAYGLVGISNANIRQTVNSRQLKILYNEYGDLNLGKFANLIRIKIKGRGYGAIDYLARIAGLEDYYRPAKHVSELRPGEALTFSIREVGLIEDILHREANRLVGVDFRRIASLLQGNSDTREVLIRANLAIE